MSRSFSTHLYTPLLLFLASCMAGCGTPTTVHLGKTLQQWSEQLEADDRFERLAAIRAIGDIARMHPEDSSGISLLIRAIDRDDRAVRYWSVRSLGVLGERAAPAVDRLVRLLEDPAPEVRIWAAYALCRQGRLSDGRPILIRELSSDNGAARLHAAHALEALGEDARPAVHALRGILEDEFNYPGRVARRTLQALDELPKE